jgi:hypothetical protein
MITHKQHLHLLTLSCQRMQKQFHPWNFRLMDMVEFNASLNNQ